MELMVSTAMIMKDRADTVQYRRYNIVILALRYRITSQNIVPWFQFDSLVLSSRIMMIFAISFAVLAHAVYFISGNWNWVLSGLDEKVKKWLARTASILYFLSGSFLIIVSGLFTDIILRAYANDSKMGPTHSIGMVQHDENLVRYEFGACLCKFPLFRDRRYSIKKENHIIENFFSIGRTDEQFIRKSKL